MERFLGIRGEQGGEESRHAARTALSEATTHHPAYPSFRRPGGRGLVLRGTRPPSESVSSVINRFSPKDVPADRWQRVEPVVKEAVTRVGFTDAELARKCMSIVGQLALWADRIGHPIDLASLFTPELIDRFITEGVSISARDPAQLPEPALAGGVSGRRPQAVSAPVRSVKASDLWAPYSPAEITELVSWSRGLPTVSMRRDSWALLALGLGTGCRVRRSPAPSAPMSEWRTASSWSTCLGPAVSRPDGSRSPLGREVLGLAEESAERRSSAGPDRIVRNDILGFIRRCSPDDSPRFSIQRLRVTWIVAHLTAGTHLTALQEAAGVGPVSWSSTSVRNTAR